MLRSQVFIALIVVFVSFKIFRRIQLVLKKRHFEREYGCKPVTRFPQHDRILGLDWFRAQLNAYRSNTFLQAATERYDQAGLTFSGTTMGRTFLLTIDTENIRAMLATSFQDFGLGTRMYAMGPFLGSGIFTTDGKAWEHSRVCTSSRYQLYTPDNGSTLDCMELADTHAYRLLSDQISTKLRSMTLVNWRLIFSILLQECLRTGPPLICKSSFSASRSTVPQNSFSVNPAIFFKREHMVRSTNLSKPMNFAKPP